MLRLAYRCRDVARRSFSAPHLQLSVSVIFPSLSFRPTLARCPLVHCIRPPPPFTSLHELSILTYTSVIVIRRICEDIQVHLDLVYTAQESVYDRIPQLIIRSCL
ncbi:hypothetical protein BDR07DRAFT_280838 [Suillus spraguei]|nr:hypothetical protein BDR07DRAFT_280838 [Suillus spraguei]